jgi:hypothetical protein
MSIRLMTAVGELRIASKPKLVLLKLSDCADDDGGNCYPSIGALANYAGTSTRHTQRIMAAFQRLGIVDIEAGENGGRGKFRRYLLDLERAGTMIPKIVKGDMVSPFYDPLKGDMGDQKGDMGDTKRVTPESPDPSKNHQEPGARAHEPGGAHGPGGADAPPACAVWRDNQAALEALACWPLLRSSIPDEDDGKVLTLAVEAPVVGFAILAWAAPTAGPVLGRRLACVVRNWVQPALFQRGIRKVGVPDASAHRRNNEPVTLQDPAWRMWRAKATELGAPEISAITTLCLPDDLDQTGLRLFVGSVAIANMLAEEGGKEVARVLGVPIRTSFLWCMDTVLDARRAYDPRGSIGHG